MREFLNRFGMAFRLLKSRNYVLITDKGADMNVNVKSPFLIDDQMKVEAQLEILSFYEDSFKHILERFKAEVKKYGGGKARSIT